jgi:hypothetical protein
MKQKWLTKSLIMAIAAFSMTSQAYASWKCNASCTYSQDHVLLTIARLASGPEYSDFDAECSQLGGTSTFPGESGCDYVYCKTFQSGTQTVIGEGTSLTEARQNARSACGEASYETCRLSNYRRVTGYDCHEN